MTETPPDHRQDPPLHGDERAQILGFLDYHRETLLLKTADLSAEQLSQTLPPSSMTLGGLVKHLAYVEDNWLSEVLHGNDGAEPWRSADWEADADWEWHSAADDDPDELRGLFRETVERSRAYVDGVALETLSARPDRRTGESFNLRWILLHLVEEYARHNGHADLLREAVDGVTGE